MTRKGYISATREWLGDNDMVVGCIETRIHYLFSPGCEPKLYGPTPHPGDDPEIELDFVQLEAGENRWSRIERNSPAAEFLGPDGEDWYDWAEGYLVGRNIYDTYCSSELGTDATFRAMADYAEQFFAARALLQAPPTVEAEGVKVRVAVVVNGSGKFRAFQSPDPADDDENFADLISYMDDRGPYACVILTHTLVVPTIPTIPARVETAGAA